MGTLNLDELVARGDIPGAYPVSGYGYRVTVGAESNYPVWSDGPFVTPPDGGVQLSLVSTSANDTSGGTGINSVEVHYLDDRLNSKHEVVTLAGLTPATTAATNIFFIQDIHVHNIGSLLLAAGNISASNGGITYDIILAGTLRSANSFRMVPAGKRLFVTGAVGSSISGTAAARTALNIVSTHIDNHTHKDPIVLVPLSTIGLQDGAIGFTFGIVPPLPPGAIVGATHSSDKACSVTVTWFGRIEGL